MFSTPKLLFRYITFLFFIFLLLFNGKPDAFSQSGKKNKTVSVVSQHGMVVSAHPMASAIGLEVLKEGGTAMEAAIAVQFALAVVYPGAGNIGGGGFMVIREADGTIATLDFREKAPAAAYPELFQDQNGEIIPGASVNTHLSVGVPGTVDGMMKVYERYGKIPLYHLIHPAIELAETGFPLTEKEANKLNELKNVLLERNGKNRFIRKSPWRAGDVLIQPELDHALHLIVELGRAGFYEGRTARNIVKEMQSGNGIITMEDLANYESIWREPVIGNYNNYRIISMGPPSSGGIALIQLLKILENYPLKKWGWNKSGYVHLLTEAQRRVYADRATYLGDPDFFEVPIQGLLEQTYLKDRMADFDLKQASKSQDIKAGQVLVESEETTHFSIVDSFGNAVAVTTTLNGSFGSRIIVEGSGFFLNNEMDDFSSKPGVPNMYGLVGAEANQVEGGKRMLSSMTPTIIEKDGLLFMVVGTPGGSTIITSVLQTFLNVVEHDMTMQQAVEALRVHHQWLPEPLFIEEGALKRKAVKKLSRMGHVIVPRGPIGRVDAILIRADGMLEGGADIRGDDCAVGY